MTCWRSRAIGRAEMQKTDVNLDELVRETLSDFQAETKERKIVWKIHPLPAVRADRALLRMVLVNLISNAVKFTGARAEAKIEIGCAPGGNGETVIFIRDNGAGFDPKYADKLFGVFQRLHSQDEFEGTGIGLANVQRIIQRHGGRVWAEGVVDGGATFYFSIPNKPTGGIDMNTEIKNILLAEDDPQRCGTDAGRAGGIPSGQQGYRSSTTARRRWIIFTAGENSSARGNGNPIVVLLDLKMPKVNGLEVLRQIKADENLKDDSRHGAHFFPRSAGLGRMSTKWASTPTW